MGKRERRKQKRTSGGLRIAALCALLVAVSAVLTPAAPASETAGPVGSAVVLAAPHREEILPPEAPQEPETPKMPEVPVSQEPETPAEPMEDTYFADVVFLGDSRTEGFSLYSGLKEGTYLFAVGATVESVFTKAVAGPDGKKAPLLDTLAETDCGKVYVMLGVNELGWVSPAVFQDQYAKVIDRIRTDHPEAVVVIQSLPPVSATQDAKKTYVNNRRIRTYNALLEELAAQKDCPYVDVAAAVAGEDGCLPAAMTFDGVHLNPAGCRAWLDYLRCHPV